MKRLAFLAMGILWPATAWSLDAVVTGGEHNDFTRLVVTLPQQMDWRLGRVADGYTLSVNQPDILYDLNKAFTRIPKTRLADVAQVPSTSDLHIVAACPCYVTAFAFRPNVIVVDIRAGVPPVESDFEQPLVSYSASGEVVDPIKTQETQRNDEIALDWTQRVDAPSPLPTPPAVSFETQLPSGFRESIVEQIGAAASQGLVTLDPSAPTETSQSTAANIDAASGKETHIRVVTEAGMDMRLGGRDDETSPLQENCLAENAVDIASWGKSDEDPAVQLAAIHAALVTDAESLPLEKATDAAKRYLYLGFGAEAGLLVDSLVEPAAEHRALKDMGRILDGQSIDQSIFAGMEMCKSPVALWAVLARDHLRPSEPIETGAVVQGFSALPYRLREMLAARLIDRLLEKGDEQSAHMIRDTISRVVEETPAAMQMATARLELREDHTENAKAALEAVSSAPGPEEPAALVGLVEMDFAARNPVSAERIAMLETLAAQNKGQKIEPELRRALVLAYSLSGEFDVAKRILEDAPAAEGGFWTLLAEQGADSDILNLAFSPPNDAGAVREESKVAIAQKLLSLGFPKQSLAWLEKENGRDVKLLSATKLLSAEAHLALFEPQKALETVAGMGEEADLLRLKSMQALGRAEEAASLLEGNPSLSDQVAAMQKTQRNWNAVASHEGEAWATAASLAIEAIPTEAAITLSGANSVASRAAKSREALQQFLNMTRDN